MKKLPFAKSLIFIIFLSLVSISGFAQTSPLLKRTTYKTDKLDLHRPLLFDRTVQAVPVNEIKTPAAATLAQMMASMHEKTGAHPT